MQYLTPSPIDFFSETWVNSVFNGCGGHLGIKIAAQQGNANDWDRHHHEDDRTDHRNDGVLAHLEDDQR